MNSKDFIQTIFSFSEAQNDEFESKIFIEVAREAITKAEKEIKFGQKTTAAIAESDDENTGLTGIAVWHYQKGIAQYEQAVTNLEQAKRFKISAKSLKYIETKMKKCLEKIAVSGQWLVVGGQFN